jgi:predicted restriction endonuclease
VSVASAQDGSRIEALKVAYLTRKMNLSPEEAQRFWPIYNLYSNEIKEARAKAKQNGKTELELEETILNIRKKYNAEFNKALSPEKVDMFYKSEKEFGNFIKNEMERRQLRQQQKRSMLGNRP